MSNKSKIKGKSWERDVANFLTKHYNESFLRVPNSGAFVGGYNIYRTQTMTEQQVKSFKGDIIPGPSFSNLVIECKNYKDLCLEDLLKYTKNPKCIGIGESGLDFFYENSSKELQIKLFKIHIEAARKSSLPLIVHTRAADNKTIEILQNEMKKGIFSGLIHCFSTSRELAEKAIDLGFYISISGIITFNKSNELRNIVKELPLNRLLVETDAPYLAPEPFRGKCNEPSYVLETAKYIANLLNLSCEEFCNKTTENFYRLFSKST